MYDLVVLVSSSFWLPKILFFLYHDYFRFSDSILFVSSTYSITSGEREWGRRSKSKSWFLPSWFITVTVFRRETKRNEWMATTTTAIVCCLFHVQEEWRKGVLEGRKRRIVSLIFFFIILFDLNEVNTTKSYLVVLIYDYRILRYQYYLLILIIYSNYVGNYQSIFILQRLLRETIISCFYYSNSSSIIIGYKYGCCWVCNSWRRCHRNYRVVYVDNYMMIWPHYNHVSQLLLLMKVITTMVKVIMVGIVIESRLIRNAPTAVPNCSSSNKYLAGLGKKNKTIIPKMVTKRGRRRRWDHNLITTVPYDVKPSTISTYIIINIGMVNVLLIEVNNINILRITNHEFRIRIINTGN